MSFGKIAEKQLCFDLKKCRKKDKKYLITSKQYGHIHYSTTGTKYLIFKFIDEYGNSKSIKKKINIVCESCDNSLLLTLPKFEKKPDYLKLTLA
jgi:hypothetical protein